MEVADIAKSLIEGGLAFGLAAVVIYWYRSDSLERLKHADKRSKEAEDRTRLEREDKLLLVQIVQANTSAMTRLEAVILQQEQRERREETRR